MARRPVMVTVNANGMRYLPPQATTQTKPYGYREMSYQELQTVGTTNEPYQQYRDQPSAPWQDTAAEKPVEHSMKERYANAIGASGLPFTSPNEKPPHFDAPPRYSVAVEEPRAAGTSYVPDDRIPTASPPREYALGSFPENGQDSFGHSGGYGV
jgi:hypothetical protein